MFEDETAPVSWSLVFALDLSREVHVLISSDGYFLLDEEKKLALCCGRRYGECIEMDDHHNMDMDKVYCVGEDFDAIQVYSRVRVDTLDSYGPAILNYVPSLAQIEPLGGYKRRPSSSYMLQGKRTKQRRLL